MAGKTLTYDDYTLLKDAYEGNGGFKSGDYLVQHKRESQTSYQTRQQTSYYLNYVQPVINSHVNPIFRKNPVRNWKGSNQYWEEFVNNSDLFGSSLTQFMKQAGFLSKLFGVSFVVMDNFKNDQQSTNQAEALKNRQFPYIYNVTPDKVVSYTLDSKKRLSSIVYEENVVDPSEQKTAVDIAALAATGKGDKGNGNDKQYRCWTLTEWATVNKDGKVVDQGTHNLGIVPVVPLYSKNTIPGNIMPDSEFFSIAKTNLRLFNLCSELDEILRNQAFSILIYPGRDLASLTVGVNNALGFDGTESRFAPSFIAPPSAPAEVIMSQMDRLITEMYRMAMLTHVSGSSEARTGAAKAWDFEVTNQVLADFAGNCCKTEYSIAKLFALWTSTSIEDVQKELINYKCIYSDDFSIRDTEQELKEATMSLQLGIGGLYDVAIKQHVAALTLKDSVETDIDAIKQEIASNQTQTQTQTQRLLGEGDGTISQQEDTTRNGGGTSLPRD